MYNINIRVRGEGGKLALGREKEEENVSSVALLGSNVTGDFPDLQQCGGDGVPAQDGGAAAHLGRADRQPLPHHPQLLAALILRYSQTNSRVQ